MLRRGQLVCFTPTFNLLSEVGADRRFGPAQVVHSAAETAALCPLRALS